MKLNAALAKTLLMAASVGMVVPLVAATPAAKAKTEKPTAGKEKGAAKAAPSTANKAEAPEPVIPGIVLPRTKGGFVSMQVDGGKFKLTFYDAKKQQIAPDVVRASARWNSPKRIGDDHTVLNPGGDKALIGGRYVQPPYIFKLYVTLLDEEGTASESYVFDMKPSS